PPDRPGEGGSSGTWPVTRPYPVDNGMDADHRFRDAVGTGACLHCRDPATMLGSNDRGSAVNGRHMNIVIVDDQTSARTMLRHVLEDISPELEVFDFGDPQVALDWCEK